jgi:16S rRNA (guanine527-N7)-methyltransferase
LKGGDLTAELRPFKRIVEEVPLNHYFKEPFFQTKKLIYLPMG